MRPLLIAAAALLVVFTAGAGAIAADQRGEPAGAGDRRELVVLVHGMGRSRASMWLLGNRLEREGYRVLNWGYSLDRDSVPTLGAALAAEVEGKAAGAPRVHFVGHSLGTVLIRWTLANRPPARAGRAVLLAPPNQGSAAADRWAPYLAWALPQIVELKTARGSTARSIPAPRRGEVAVIAGAWDGKVSVEETRLAWAREHVVVPSHHSFLMDRRDVQSLVLRFLRTGEFDDGANAASE